MWVPGDSFHAVKLQKYFMHMRVKEKRNHDVLASEQGPSCSHLDQLPSLNLIFMRFTTPASIQNSDNGSKSWILYHLR